MLSDPATLDLPFSCWRQLVYNLARFDCLAVRDSRRWKLYATMQMELFAFKRNYESKSKMISTRNATMAGASAYAFAGLDFHCVLERLCLLLYGKVVSLPYAVQMDEFKTEQRHVALNMIQCLCVAYVYRRRIEQQPELMHPAWRKRKAAYCIAVEGARASRLRSLTELRKLVLENSPLLHFGDDKSGSDAVRGSKAIGNSVGGDVNNDVGSAVGTADGCGVGTAVG